MFGLTSRGQSSFDGNVAGAVIAIVAVAIRLFCKVKSKQGVKSDDYWILAALAFHLTAASVGNWGYITGGGGLELDEFFLLIKEDPKNIDKLSNYFVSVYIAYAFVLTSIYCIKMSILMFYRRIFLVTTGYKQISLILILLSTALFISSQIAELLICQPIEAYWNRLKPGKCLNFGVLYLSTGIIDLLLDIAILALPIRMALKLHLPLRTRFAVAGIFALGGFVVIAQIFRLSYVYNPHSANIKLHEGSLWTNIHEATAIVGACLPLYKPVWAPVAEFISRYAGSIKFKISSGSRHKAKMGSKSSMRLNSYKTTSEAKSGSSDSACELRNDTSPGHRQFTITGGTGNESDVDALDLPKQGITCSHRLDIV
ncbi:hypothetical protein EJ04DRAFT_550958 [Polyplosphaeria fusca]|uniref:Rhodopsin domain-containing protein n=1 Tax=Polyplosphaeria fusca TaxID=682080 RepID=A0A9P4V626_9PLEO|nr:hypothetical protein EJ04DRAFT_550958 [Polyplosphaeria fusca]